MYLRNVGAHEPLGDVQEPRIGDEAQPEGVAVREGLVEVLGALLRVLLLQPPHMPGDLLHERGVQHVLRRCRKAQKEARHGSCQVGPVGRLQMQAG